jgi:hypothetical protein
MVFRMRLTPPSRGSEVTSQEKLTDWDFLKWKAIPLGSVRNTLLEEEADI